MKKSRLQPGKMLLVDTVQGRIIDDAELKETYAARQPYGEWLDRDLHPAEGPAGPQQEGARLLPGGA